MFCQARNNTGPLDFRCVFRCARWAGRINDRGAPVVPGGKFYTLRELARNPPWFHYPMRARHGNGDIVPASGNNLKRKTIFFR